MLYLIKSGDYFKIGCSKDKETLERRLAVYDSCNPDYEILKIIDGDFLLEGLYHLYYKDLLHRGEWFYIPKEGIEVILKDFDSSKITEIKNKIPYGGKLLKRDFMEYIKTGETEIKYLKTLKKYFTVTRMNSVHWNRDMLQELIVAEKRLNKVKNDFHIGLTSGFYTTESLRKMFRKKLGPYSTVLVPKGSMISQCKNIKAYNAGREIDGTYKNGFVVVVQA